MSGLEGSRRASERLGEQQAVVDQVVVLEAAFDVPVAQSRRDYVERKLALQTGRDDASIAERARRGSDRPAACCAVVPVAARADGHPGGGRNRQRNAIDLFER